MKNLILLLVLFIPLSIIAQDKVDVNKAVMNDQTDEWMTRISSDSEMRGIMMNMMIEKTKDNKVEMRKLINCMLNNSEMNKMMLTADYGKAENENISIAPRGIITDSIKVSKVFTTTPVQEK